MSRIIIVAYILFGIQSPVLANSDSTSTNAQNSWDVLQVLQSLSKTVENLETKIEMQTTLLNNLGAEVETQATTLNNIVIKEQLQVILLNKLETKSEVQGLLLKNLITREEMHGILLNNLVTKEEMQTTSLNNLEAKLDMQVTLLNSLEAKDDIQGNSLIKLEVTADMQANLLSDVMTKEAEQATSLKNLEARTEIQATVLINLLNKVGEQAICSNNVGRQENLSNNSSIEDRTLETEEVESSEAPHNSSTSKGVAEGIIAGTNTGVVVISLDSREQRQISAVDSKGVAFNWITRKVYWVEWKVGIKRANLDGTAEELLISDTSYLYGLAVDPITGNFYYGIRSPKREIRVCASSVENCAVVASGASLIGENLFDIAVNPLGGTMFWSNDKTVTRANMDGTDTTVVISGNTYGLCVDEDLNRLYSVNVDSRSIATYNSNGSIELGIEMLLLIIRLT